jgi:hypothetical protein
MLSFFPNSTDAVFVTAKHDQRMHFSNLSQIKVDNCLMRGNYQIMINKIQCKSKWTNSSHTLIQCSFRSSVGMPASQTVVSYRPNPRAHVCNQRETFPGFQARAKLQERTHVLTRQKINSDIGLGTNTGPALCRHDSEQKQRRSSLP